MIALEDDNGNKYSGSVVLEDGERALLVILMYGNERADTLRLDQANVEEALSSLDAWCGYHSLDEASTDALASAVRMEFSQLQKHRRLGPDPSLDWPGSRSDRQVPSSIA